jgi:putative ABC transport system permease protein
MTPPLRRSPLLELALMLCPRAFRADYRDQIYADTGASGATAAAAFDVARYGVGVRVEALARDVMLAARSLAKARMFSAVSVLTLALAISVNAAVFAVVQAALLQPLPFAEPDQLVFLCPGTPPHCGGQLEAGVIGAYQRSARTFSGVAAFQYGVGTLTGYSVPQSLSSVAMSTNALDVLRARTVLGRGFTAADGAPNGANVLISEQFWKRTLSADPHVVGKALTIDGVPRPVVGVVADEFVLPTPMVDVPQSMTIDLFAPLETRTFSELGGMHNWAFARLGRGAAAPAADREIQRVTAQVVREHPFEERGLTVAAVPFSAWYHQRLRTLLMLMAAAALAVLIIACANVANLLLVRAMTRRGELALRSALGATRGRIVRELLIEIALLAVAGGAIGLLLAGLELRTLIATTAAQLPSVAGASLNATVVLFTLAVIMAATLLAGLLPAFSATGKDLAASLKTIGRGADGASVKAVRAGLAIVEIALAFGVVAASGLFVRSSLALAAAPLGLDPHGVYYAMVALNTKRYERDAARAQFAQALSERIAALPGVEAATTARHAPYSFLGTELSGYRVPGRAYAPKSASEGVITQIGPDYFRALRVPLLAGRAFARGDDARAPRVAIVDEAIARRDFAGRNAVGAQILIPDRGPSVPAGGGSVPATIVGVARDVTPNGRRDNPRVYVPNAQVPAYYTEVVVRMRTPDPELRRHIAAAVADLDPNMALVNFTSVEERAAAANVRQRTSAVMLGILAAVALLLALGGIYAIVAYSVEQRRHEFGIRVAVGARGGDIARTVLGGALRIAVLGIACGFAVAAFATRSLDELLYAVSTFDPVTFGAGAALVLTCVAVASAVPAVRAMRVDPAVALRYE